MAKKFLTPIDLNQLELQNARLQNLATAPSSPVKGQVYFNTTNNEALVWNGTAWVPWDGVKKTTTTPKMDGTAAIGSETKYAAGDHIHPTDTSRAPLSSPAFTGTPTAPTATTGNDSTQIATTAFVNSKIWYGTCSTAAATTAKTVTLSGFKLNTGSWVAVKFTVTNTGAVGSLTLNVNSTGAKSIKYRGSNLTSAGVLAANRVYLFVYDGTNYELIGDLDTNTTYSGGTQAQLEAGTATANYVWQPKILHDYIASAIGGADAMRFKGTIGTGGDITALPTTGVKVGDTYRVITAGTYAGQTCEIGDLIIATATTPTWTVAQTNIDGAITSISGTAPISVTGSGNSRTVAHSNSGVTAASKGDISNQTPGWGSTFKALSGTVNATGHLTAFAEHTVKIPNSTATTSAAGLMSSSDKQNLDNLMNSYDATQISAGSTSVSVSSPVMDYMAYIVNSSSAYEEVVVDCSNSISGSTVTTTFSIAAAINKDINIMYQIGG